MPARDEVLPLRGLRIGGGVRLPGLGPLGGAVVGHVGGVVLVGQAGEVMAELVHEDVGREGVVGGHRGVQVEDAAAAVLAVVHHDLDELVGRRRRRPRAARLLSKVEHVALGAEGVVGGAQRRAAVDAVRGPRHAALVGRRVDGPHVEVARGAP